jgi:adenosylcobinamide-GDP ribazoletransferase
VSKDLNPSSLDLAKSSKFFPLIGIILGVLSWGLYWLLTKIGISSELSIIVSIISVMFMTGGFHEDGLADTFDGIGGAFSKKKKLEIMKDSRLGTYGALALISALALRFTSITEIPENLLMASFAFSLMVGRLTSNILIPTTPYVSEDSSSKSKPVITDMAKSKYIIITIFYVGISHLFFPYKMLLPLFLMLGILIWVLRKYFMKKIDGITGDVLGGINIISELFTLIYIATWANKYI